MAGTHVKLTPDLKVAEQLRSQQMAGRHGQLMSRLGEYLLESTQARYKTQVDPQGKPWAPLKPSYAKSKKYNADKILTLRGYLRSSYRYQVKDDDTVEWGTNHETAAIHQFGGTIERAPYSARVRLRTDGKGQLLTREGARGGRLARFAKERGKSAHTRYRESWHEVKAYSIAIPARPALGVSAEDQQRLLAIISDYTSRR
jgi:phage virion morphogenesis protein